MLRRMIDDRFICFIRKEVGFIVNDSLEIIVADLDQRDAAPD